MPTHLPDFVYHVSFRRHRPLKLSLSCEVVETRWFLGPRFVGGGYSPDFGHAFSNRTYFRACGRFWLSSNQRSPRVAGEKEEEEGGGGGEEEEEEEENRMAVKPKSRKVCLAA